LGHPVSLKPPSARTGGTVTAREGAVAIIARWDGEDISELRIGDAEP
jgi:hypothetical protein